MMEKMLQRAERLPDNRIVRFADLRPLVFDGLRNRDKCVLVSVFFFCLFFLLVCLFL